MKVLSEQELKEKLAEIKPASSQESVKTELPELKKPDIEKSLKNISLPCWRDANIQNMNCAQKRLKDKRV